MRSNCLVAAGALCFVAAVGAWQLPSPQNVKNEVAKGCATLAVCASALTAGSAPVSASDDATVKINLNTPFVTELVKNKEQRARFVTRVEYVVESAKNTLQPVFTVELPSDYKKVAKDIVRGKTSVSINGLDVGINVVASEKGSLTVQVTNSLLPRLPVPGLATTPGIVGTASDAVIDTTPEVVQLLSTIQKELSQPKEPFWDAPINENSFRVDMSAGKLQVHRALTPLDVVGYGSLTLGAVYGSSYWYYLYLNEEEEREAAEKKAKIAASKKKAEEKEIAAAKKEVEEKESADAMKEAMEKRKAKSARKNAEPVLASNTTEFTDPLFAAKRMLSEVSVSNQTVIPNAVAVVNSTGAVMLDISQGETASRRRGLSRFLRQQGVLRRIFQRQPKE